MRRVGDILTITIASGMFRILQISVVVFSSVRSINVMSVNRVEILFVLFFQKKGDCWKVCPVWKNPPTFLCFFMPFLLFL